MSTRGLYVLVKVLSVHRNYVFPCCIRCSTRIRTELNENIFICSKCQRKYDKKQISYRYRINMTVSDRTQVSNVTVFGQCLENFFGTSATHLKRFVEELNLEKEELPLSVDQLIHQCIEQCFVGSMIRLCFHGLHPCQTDSQASRSSPIHLKNILTKMCDVKMNYLAKNRRISSHLLASSISRPESTEKNATVFELLKEYLELFRSFKRVTPSCSLTSGPCSVNSSGLKHNTSCQSNSRLCYTCSGRKISEDLNVLISPLVLSCEARVSSQSPATDLSNLKSKVELPIEIDSGSQTRMQNTAILNDSPNKTVLILGLLNVDKSDECINELSSDPTNDTDRIHDELRSLHNENLAYFGSQTLIGKPTNALHAIESEKQKLQSSCSWLEKDQNVVNDHKDVDLFLKDDLSGFFYNLSLDLDLKGNKITGEYSHYAKGEKPFTDDQSCDLREASREFQAPAHLTSECNILQENTDQISSLFPEDMLTDLGFSDISLLYDYDALQEPSSPTSKPSPMTSSQDNIKFNNKDFLCAENSPSVEDASSHRKSTFNSKYREVPEKLMMETAGEIGCPHGDSLFCYSSSDKSLRQEKFLIDLDLNSECVDTPAHLSFQSLIEQTSTPVLFDDSWASTESRLKLYRSLSLPKSLSTANVMERGINIHSTPVNSGCLRKFHDSSEGLQNYSGVFVDVRNKDISVSSTDSLRAKALNDCIKCVDNCLSSRKSLDNKDDLHVFASSCNQMEEALERDEDGEQECRESFSFQNEMSPSVVAEQSRRQISLESPLLFSFSSAENSDIRQDSLLCESLLECSYLK